MYIRPHGSGAVLRKRLKGFIVQGIRDVLNKTFRSKCEQFRLFLVFTPSNERHRRNIPSKDRFNHRGSDIRKLRRVVIQIGRILKFLIKSQIVLPQRLYLQFRLVTVFTGLHAYGFGDQSGIVIHRQ